MASQQLYAPGTNAQRVSAYLFACQDYTAPSAQIILGAGLAFGSLGPVLADMRHRGHAEQVSYGVWRMTEAHPMRGGHVTASGGTVAPSPLHISTLHPAGFRQELVMAAAEGNRKRLDEIIDRMASLGMCAPRAAEGARA